MPSRPRHLPANRSKAATASNPVPCASGATILHDAAASYRAVAPVLCHLPAGPVMRFVRVLCHFATPFGCARSAGASVGRLHGYRLKIAPCTSRRARARVLATAARRVARRAGLLSMATATAAPRYTAHAAPATAAR